MHDAGFGSAEIQSFAVGLPAAASPAVFTYGTPGWFDHVAAAAQSARALGMTLDLTLGSSWPSGGSYISDAQSLKQLTVTGQMVQGPSSLASAVPGPTEPLLYPVANALLQLPDTYDAAKMRLVSVLAARRATDQTPDDPPVTPTLADVPPPPATVYLDLDSVVDLTGTIANGRLQWQVPAGTWLVFALYEGPTRMAPFYGADPGGALVLDHFNADAIKTHLGAVAGTAAQRLGSDFGTTVRSLFVDSLELRTELYWTDDFLSQFAARRG